MHGRDLIPVGVAQRYAALIHHQFLATKEAPFTPVNLARAFKGVADHHIERCQHDDRAKDQHQMFPPVACHQ